MTDLGIGLRRVWPKWGTYAGATLCHTRAYDQLEEEGGTVVDGSIDETGAVHFECGIMLFDEERDFWPYLGLEFGGAFTGHVRLNGEERSLTGFRAALKLGGMW